MEDSVSEGIGAAMGELGIAGGFFILLIALLVGSYRLAMQYMINQGKKKKSTPEPASDRSPGLGTMMGIAKEEVEQARQVGLDKLKGLQKELDTLSVDTKERFKKIDKKDEAQDEWQAAMDRKVIALEEWRKSKEKS